MEDEIFTVGQEFPDVKALRNAVKEAAIAQHFELKTVKSDLIRYVAKCAAEGCPWRIRGVKLPNVQTFTIRSIERTHSCGKNARAGHQQASVDWIVSFIEERLRDDVNYKPKDILDDVFKQYGITISYKQAWRAKERGLEGIYGSSEEGYSLLPTYCEQIIGNNPGSVAEVFTSGSENRFQRVFISFNASIHGFLNGCLPLVGLGAVQLKSKYLGTLLSATSFDSDGGLFLVAFAIVDVDNDESWMWFLSELRKLIEMHAEIMPQLTFLSNGLKSIVDAVKRRFFGCYHAICMKHLTESIGKEFKNPRLVQILWKAAYATTNISFKEKIADIEEVSVEAAKWLQQFPPSCWALLYFEGVRYGHLSSNVHEFNRWILEARELPIIKVIERVHTKLISEFDERRAQFNSWFSILVPSADNHVIEAMNRASSYKVLRSNEVEFEVVSAERSDIVNIGTRSCSCRDWQLYRLPCSHAVAALVSCGKDVYAFTERYFSVACYCAVYGGKICPVKTDWRERGGQMNSGIGVVKPPKIRRLPGRPDKKRMCVEDVNREKHIVHCSRCNRPGHYKLTCKADVLLGIE